MDKLDLQTPNFSDKNIQKLSELFPNCVTESAEGKSIDFDLLKQELSNHIVEGNKERYQLAWPGKAESLVTANTPSNKTLRPDRDESKCFDKTKNIFIEGDNLEVLKLLQETYLGKVKMIYIDPPYNTGSDFVYKDNFTQDKAKYDEEVGNKDEEGGRLISNPDSNGRFHSDWLSMIYPRLKLARNILSDDGVIFISIDDNENENLKKVCNENFGEANFIAELCWEKKKKGTFLSNSLTNIKESILVYAKNINLFNGLIGEIKTDTETYPCINASNKREIRTIPKGIVSKYRDADVFLPKGSEISVTTMSLVLHSDLVIKNNLLVEDLIIEGNWRYTQDKMEKYARENNLYITQDLYLRRIVNDARYKTLKDLLPRVGTNQDLKYSNFNINNLFEDGWGSNEDGEEEFRLIMKEKSILEFPKPTKLIKKLAASIRDKNCIILDFFAGSGTTAHAVMQLNAEDGGTRQCISVQLPEITDENSEAFKAGYKNIAEIGKERIRRAGEQIKTDNVGKEGVDDLDTGFRVLKVDSSNMKDVYYTPDSTSQSDILNYANNIKDDRSEEDLLFQVLLDWGIDLSVKIEKKKIAGRAVYFADDDYLATCFENNLDESFVKEVIKCVPRKVVLRDSGFESSSVKINVEQLFKQASIEVKVI